MQLLSRALLYAYVDLDKSIKLNKDLEKPKNVFTDLIRLKK